MNKKELRQFAKVKRKTLDTKTASESIVKQIINIKEYKLAKNILIFYPLQHEVDLLDLTKDKDKNFFLPKMNDKNLLVCPYQPGDELKESQFKTKEPICDNIKDLSALDVVFVPALMADKQKNRLGYGGGFYDRFLATLPKNIIKIVPIFKELVIEALPYEPFDIKADIVIKDI